MPAPVKKTTAKKAAAKRSPAPKPGPGRRASNEADPLTDRILKMREQDKGWKEIADTLGTSIGRVAHAYECATVPNNQKIKFTSDDDLGQKVRNARDTQGLSWGTIAARAGVPESRVRRLYTDLTGTPTRGLRIGKGGRYPSEVDRPVRKAAATKKAPAAKKAGAAKKAAPTAAGKALADLSLAELKARLIGKTVTVQSATGKGTERLKVSAVKSIKNGELTFTGNGKSRTFLTTYIKNVSR